MRMAASFSRPRRTRSSAGHTLLRPNSFHAFPVHVEIQPHKHLLPHATPTTPSAPMRANYTTPAFDRMKLLGITLACQGQLHLKPCNPCRIDRPRTRWLVVHPCEIAKHQAVTSWLAHASPSLTSTASHFEPHANCFLDVPSCPS